MPPVSDNNDKGFWEDVDINKLEIVLLDKMDSDWDRLILLDDDKQCHKLAAEKKLRYLCSRVR